MTKDTGLRDRHGQPIFDGDFISLAGNITADNSLGPLPNGWTFDDTDIYQVYYDKRISNWSLKIGVEPDTSYNVKYLNHALSILHEQKATKVLEKK